MLRAFDRDVDLLGLQGTCGEGTLVRKYIDGVRDVTSYFAWL